MVLSHADVKTGPFHVSRHPSHWVFMQCPAQGWHMENRDMNPFQTRIAVAEGDKQNPMIVPATTMEEKRATGSVDIEEKRKEIKHSAIPLLPI